MNIVDFYKKLSKLLEDYREERITYSTALRNLKELLENAKNSKLDVNISENILDMENLTNYDDERSYESVSYDESSYDDYDDETYQSSY